MNENNPVSPAVLIAGGGATGAMLALWLARFGIGSMVVESRAAPYDIPRAHALNPRSLEICAALGLDMARLRALGAPREDAGHVRFVARLLGPEYGNLPYERQDDDAGNYTPHVLFNIPQTDFEAVLFDAVSAEPLIDYRREHRWVAGEQRGDVVHSTIATPSGELSVTTKYLIGCDGAGSPVRESLGIGMEGDAAVFSCLSIVFQADLRKQLAHRPGMLFFNTDPGAPGTFIAYHLDRTWSYVLRFPPGPIPQEMFEPERCRQLVIDAIGEEVDDLKIINPSPWTMAAQVAESYRDGNIFLAGDAAHRFPPSGGLGLNTGIQDVHNLAWKIAAVEQGWATPTLFETYQPERRPVAMRNSQQSLTNAQLLAKLAACACEKPVWGDSIAFADWLGEEGRQAAIDDAVEAQRPHFDSFGLQLGFAYVPGWTETVDVSLYTPCAEAGHRMPHAVVKRAGETLSTLDLLDPLRFTVFGKGAVSVGVSVHHHIVDVADLDIPADWLQLTGLHRGGVLAVRPDGHVLWKGPAEGLASAMVQLLGK